MVDVSEKPVTTREAVAVATICLPTFVTDRLDGGDIMAKKGPVFATAIIAGTMAVKNTSSLIPFCHPLPIDNVAITISVKEPGKIAVQCFVKSVGRTGVEMEALHGVSCAALTIYDMCKALTKDIVIGEIKVTKKIGGTRDIGE